MPLNIPMPQDAATAFNNSVNSGSMLYARIMQPVIQRQQMAQQAQIEQARLAQQMKFEKDRVAYQNAQLNMAGQMLPFQKQMLQQQIQESLMKTDPNKRIDFAKKVMAGLATNPYFASVFGNQGGQGAPTPQPQGQTPPPMFSGQGMPSQQFMQQGQQAQMPQSQPMQNMQSPMQSPMQNPMQLPQVGGMNMPSPMQGSMNQGGFNPMQQMALGLAGLPVPKITETPEQKRLGDYQEKVALENLKTQNKSVADQQKLIADTKKDLPNLEQALKNTEELERIAKNNPDMFGHSVFPGWYAKTSTNPNFGRWQTLISKEIPALEGQLSNRGSQLALKVALGFKPSHAETQQVALGKIEQMKSQMIDTINKSRKLTGQAPLPKERGLSEEDLRRIAGGR
jgi:hypothetical protein